MKIARHSKILELINQYDIETGCTAAGCRLSCDAGHSFQRHSGTEADENCKAGRRLQI